MSRAVADVRVGDRLVPYRVVARNNAATSENKIHDDDVAREYGFRGGLVPGVTVYAYMTHPVVEAFGIEWLGRGSATVRLLKPTYEGEEATIEGEVVAAGDGETKLDLRALAPDGTLCAVMTATLPDGACETPPSVDDYPFGPLPDERPPATLEVLSGITELGTVVYDLDEARRTRYLGEASETLPLYDEKRIGHPGDTLGGANTVLASTVHLGPWIHVSSELMHHSLLREGDEVQVRGRVVNLFERKGHRFIDLEVLVVANGDRPVAAIRHTAIYEPRKGS